MALLLPDPADESCPDEFKARARSILNEFPEYKAPTYQKMLSTDGGLRHLLLHKFIADFANWDNAGSPAYIKTARALVKAAHGKEAPLVVDPFAGGASIPLEALRIGCDAFASDLNPVACLINKLLLEDISRHGPELAEEVGRLGKEIKKQCERELADVYPADPDGALPIAYLWARTVRCEQPNCGCEIPLLRSFWLAKKGKRKRALNLTVHRPKGQEPHVELKVFDAASEKDARAGTVSRAKATCPACNIVLGPDRVRAQLAEQHGGADVKFDADGRRRGGARLLAVVCVRPGETGRHYRGAGDGDYTVVFNARRRLRKSLEQWKQANDGSLGPLPDEPLPPIGTLGFRVQRYGVLRWGDLFTSRQCFALENIRQAIFNREATPEAKRLLAASFSRVAMSCMSLTRWNAYAEKMQHTFGRQALPIVWDFAEVVPIASAPGNWQSGYELVCDAVSGIPASPATGQVQQSDAAVPTLPESSAAVWFTDPPYYDAIPYSDLSDFFFVWLRRLLAAESLFSQLREGDGSLTPKTLEIVQDEAKVFSDGQQKGKGFFEKRMALAFASGRATLKDDGIGSVVFAHKTTEGWEALLGGMISGGWVITSSWPITTEMGSRLRAKESASLAASVHLVCRPREEDAGVGDWGEIIRDLPKRITDWMDRLGGEGIRGADLVFACIGPALELFSRYARVETPDGEEVGLAANENARGEPARRGFLSYVWEVAGRTALNQVLGSAESKAKNGAAGALEEDARLTALFLWTLQATEVKAVNGKNDDDDEGENEADDEADEEEGGGSTGKKKGLTLIYDVARRFAQPLGIHLDIWEGRIIETAKGIVRLLPVGERAKQLFGEEGASAVIRKFDAERKPNPQLVLDFMAEQRAAVPEVRARGRRKRSGDAAAAEGLRTRKEATTLDRVHAAMLLQASGASNALRGLLQAEMQRGPDFLRLANALSALYPRDSEEKRLLDAMLLAVPR